MQKELNPELFGEKRSSQARSEGAAGAVAGTSQALLNTDRQIFEIKSQIMNLSDQLNKTIQSLNEFSKNTNSRMERFQQALSRLETNHNGLAVEAGQKVQQINTKLAERKALDQKIQEMVDRHNNVVKSMEVRLSHLQRLLSEKENQAVAAMAAFNEAKMEIARMKRL